MSSFLVRDSHLDLCIAPDASSKTIGPFQNDEWFLAAQDYSKGQHCTVFGEPIVNSSHRSHRNSGLEVIFPIRSDLGYRKGCMLYIDAQSDQFVLSYVVWSWSSADMTYGSCLNDALDTLRILTRDNGSMNNAIGLQRATIAYYV